MFFPVTLTPSSTVTVVQKSRTAVSDRIVSNEQKCAQEIQEQFANILLNSSKVSKKIPEVLAEKLEKFTVQSHSLIYTEPLSRLDNWVNIKLVRNKTTHNNLKPIIQISFEGSTRLSDDVTDELGKYSFALYQIHDSGNDLMSWHKPFNEKSFYRYSVDIDLDEINIKPSNDFKSMVRRNYFQDDSANNSIAVLVFRKDKVGTNNLDYLLICRNS